MRSWTPVEIWTALPIAVLTVVGFVVSVLDGVSSSTVQVLIGGALFHFGMVIDRKVRTQLIVKGFYCKAETKRLVAPRELQLEGMFRYLRHPLYAGKILSLSLGVALIFPSYWGAWILAAAALAYVPRMYFEERVIVETYGEEYRDYRRRVRALIPGIL